MPTTRKILPLAPLLLLTAAAFAADETVDIADTKYPVTIQSKIADKDVKLTITGASERKKDFFKVYTIASYIDDAVTVHTPAELAEKDCAKQLHIVMQRDVGGNEMANAFVEAVRLNYPEPKFADECKTLLDFMKPLSLKTGDEVWITNLPGVGLHVKIGKDEATIKNTPFSQAIWEIYLGKKNIGEEIKKNLTSRLK